MYYLLEVRGLPSYWYNNINISISACRRGLTPDIVIEQLQLGSSV